MTRMELLTSAVAFLHHRGITPVQLFALLAMAQDGTTHATYIHTQTGIHYDTVRRALQRLIDLEMIRDAGHSPAPKSCTYVHLYALTEHGKEILRELNNGTGALPKPQPLVAPTLPPNHRKHPTTSPNPSLFDPKP